MDHAKDGAFRVCTVEQSVLVPGTTGLQVRELTPKSALVLVLHSSSVTRGVLPDWPFEGAGHDMVCPPRCAHLGVPIGGCCANPISSALVKSTESACLAAWMRQ